MVVQSLQSLTILGEDKNVPPSHPQQHSGLDYVQVVVVGPLLS
jgi:hypothetical protein